MWLQQMHGIFASTLSMTPTFTLSSLSFTLSRTYTPNNVQNDWLKRQAFCVYLSRMPMEANECAEVRSQALKLVVT